MVNLIHWDTYILKLLNSHDIYLYHSFLLIFITNNIVFVRTIFILVTNMIWLKELYQFFNIFEFLLLPFILHIKGCLLLLKLISNRFFIWNKIVIFDSAYWNKFERDVNYKVKSRIVKNINWFNGVFLR